MKQLLILRHAKSSWDDPSLDDHDRVLNERGKRDAPRMGELIVQQKCIPDHIVCSTAKRTRQTVGHICDASGMDVDKTQFLEELYGTNVNVYVNVIQVVRDDFKRLMVIGHNPTLETLVEKLHGEYERFPTAALAYFEVDIDRWEDLTLDAPAKLVNLWRPKEL